MKMWNVADAKAQFSTVLQEAESEPQVICRRNSPVAVLLSTDAYKKCTQNKSSLSEALNELRTIQEDELVEIEVPERCDRTGQWDD